MNKFIDNLSKFIATFFGLGYMPFIPGTFGSMAGAVIYYFTAQNAKVFYAVLFLLTLSGFFVAGRAERAFGRKDPRPVVIDEAAGMMIALILVPLNLLSLAVVFALFRLMDTVKPFPIRQLEDMPAGFGIMLDDIAAGIYANLAFHIVFSFASCRLL